MNAQFQLGLELANILTPLTSTITALGSLAVARAIKQSRSDALTELELASFLGRNRIDASLQYHFRKIVGNSSQTLLSRYLDIALDGGAGPTVQNSVQNPELFSMVIQLSFLCSVHEETTLAQAVVDAIERNLEKLKADLRRVPHYPSLCGTLRVCKQETASFQWYHLFDAVERKIASSWKEGNTGRRRTSNVGGSADSGSDILNRTSIAIRTLPFPVLQILLLSLHTLQHFPEERLLNIECASGISTVITWCYHVLGLNVKLMIKGQEIVFGEPSATVFVRESSSQISKVSLLHPNGQHEPLFSLSSMEGDPRIGPDLRRRAKGYGLHMIRQYGNDDQMVRDARYWVMSQSLRVLQLNSEATDQAMSFDYSFEAPVGGAKWSSHDLFGLTAEKAVRAAAFLLDCEQAELQNPKAHIQRPSGSKHISDLSVLVILVLAFARVEAEDLENCGDVLLSTQYQHQLRNDGSLRSVMRGKLQNVEIGLTRAFDVLGYFLQGPTFSEDLNKSSILVSACGWSLYFNSVSATDPAELFDSTLRIIRGVPARGDVRKTRIVDGPTQLYFSPSEAFFLENRWKSYVRFFPGVSRAQRERAFVGYQELDAFQITQPYEWRYMGDKPRKHLLGLREMIDLCSQFSFLLPCGCKDESLSFQEIAQTYVRHDDLDSDEVRGDDGNFHRMLFCYEGSEGYVFSDSDGASDPPSKNQAFTECILGAQTGSRYRPTSEAWLFYVSDDPAARWMELCDMYPELVANGNKRYQLLLRGPNTCLRCAFDAVIPKITQQSVESSENNADYSVICALF